MINQISSFQKIVSSEYQSMAKKHKTQWLIGWGVLALVLAIYIWRMAIVGNPEFTTTVASTFNAATILLVATGLGFFLVRGMTGFAGAYSQPMSNNGTTIARRVIVIAMIITVFANLSLLQSGFGDGYGTGIGEISLSRWIGMLIFGVGMTFAYGCASGCGTNVGEYGGSWGFVGLLAAILGGAVASRMIASGDWGAMNPGYWGGTFGQGVSIRDLAGSEATSFMGAFYTIFFTLSALFILWIGLKMWENKKNGVEHSINEDAAFEKASTWDKMFTIKLKSVFTIIVLAVLFTIPFILKGYWGVSSVFRDWGDLVYFGNTNANGAQVFNGIEGDSKFFFNNYSSMQMIGFIAGGTIAMLWSGKMTMKMWNIKSKAQALSMLKTVSVVTVGAFLMGLGARLGQGCNAGGLFSGIIYGKGSAWIMLVTLGLAVYPSVKLRQKLKLEHV